MSYVVDWLFQLWDRVSIIYLLLLLLLISITDTHGQKILRPQLHAPKRQSTKRTAVTGQRLQQGKNAVDRQSNYSFMFFPQRIVVHAGSKQHGTHISSNAGLRMRKKSFLERLSPYGLKTRPRKTRVERQRVAASTHLRHGEELAGQQVLQARRRAVAQLVRGSVDNTCTENFVVRVREVERAAFVGEVQIIQDELENQQVLDRKVNLGIAGCDIPIESIHIPGGTWEQQTCF
ncbi:hypothetical protein B0H17DRAFT_1144036 [Mycena rosella]|uniref:Uncharacterized protein n=1 Tax=Mycena rosella TaxID=1033263 RepID=A0AAD7CXQ2_MYCRO|nr:hypothetical protein B0H17DRAFT_1144036 [Mycena rosella]